MRKILCMILALIIICSSFSIITYATDTNDVNNTNSTSNTINSTAITDLQTQHQEVQEQLHQATEELDGVQNELSDNLIQVQKLDENISNSETELADLNTKIDELKKSIEEIETELSKKEESYNKQKQLLEERLIALYEAGDTNYLDVILSSRTLSEFLSNYFFITEIASHDTALLDEIEEQKNEIELTKKTLDKNKEELTKMWQKQTVTSKVLQNSKIVRENYIQQLSDQEKEIQAKIDEYTTQFAQINAEILELAANGISTTYIGGVMAWPIPGYTRITSNYGMRTHPITGVYKLHTGVDVGAPIGADFVAANDGIVTKAEYNYAYGNMVIIDHGGGISTLYAHGSEIVVQVGQTVKRGEPVLKVGSTGYSTGPHAHFEVRINGVVTNPLEYITTNIPADQISNNQNNETSENTTNE